jgi:hypothetical protein
MSQSGLSRRMLALAALAAGALGIYVGLARGSAVEDSPKSTDSATYTIGLFGDMPYNAMGKADYPFLLQDINDEKVSFSVFDGDLKSGGDGPCSDSLYTTAIANFNSLKRPLVWVPGDNDWTDCWGRYGPGTQPYSDPLERLAHERQLFTSTPNSLGQKTLELTRESREGGAYALYSENVRWTKGSVVYLGLNVQGSNDNYPYAGVDGETRSDQEIQRQRNEEIARKAAALHWLSEGFDFAKKIGAKGVMIIWQADPNFNNEQKLSDTRSYDAYADYINALRSNTIAFDGQVVLVHGDSHYFKVDKPLTRASGRVLGNFTRVETFGAGSTDWVEATIDPQSRNLITFQPMVVAATDK